MSGGGSAFRSGAALEPITPNWPAPLNVRAFSTTRAGGVSPAPYDSLNLGVSSGDDPQRVDQNRRRLVKTLALPESPRWLAQVHGDRVVDAAGAAGRPEADAATARRAGQVLAVLTADCVPVLICDRDGQQVAAAHAGWRGLAAGVLERTVAAFGAPPGELMAWLGPGIGPTAFEVGPEVRDAFLAPDPGASAAFGPGRRDRLMADLYALSRRRLARAGVGSVYGGEYCTYSDASRFFSHRRDGPKTGRMAAVIWLDPEDGA